MNTLHAPTAPTSDLEVAPVPVRQYRLGTAILLHLFPGIALTIFIVLAAPLVRSLGIPTAFTLFLGIPLVIVPLELGYLLLYAKRTTGSYALRGAVGYHRRLPLGRLVAWTAGLTVWFLVFFLASTVLLDEWLATNLFGWLPDAILQFSTFQDADGPTPGPLLTGSLVAIALLCNGLLGPIVEERYFRGHLLPRIERFGHWAPLLNVTLFSLYHLWTPWQNPARIIGFLPIAWAARRERSLQLATATHVTINLLFLGLLFAATLGANG